MQRAATEATKDAACDLACARSGYVFRVRIVEMNQSIRLLQAAETDPALANELRGWFEEEFGRADRWAEPDFYVILSLEEQLAGRLAILDRQVSVDGATVRVGGIGGVATKTKFRHRGVASAMLVRAAEFMKNDLEVEFGFLLCRHEVSPVYTKMGWIIVPGPTTFTRAGVVATYPNDTMILPLTERRWPSGPIDMLGLPW
jgi:aminoglycoside 2'-N-acetyltransferase I